MNNAEKLIFPVQLRYIVDRINRIKMYLHTNAIKTNVGVGGVSTQQKRIMVKN